MRSAEFAAARGSRLEQSDRDLQPVVDGALSHWKSGTDWYAPIVEGASVLWRELFEDSSPDTAAADEDALMAQFQKELGETLAKTGDPATAASNQARTITYWVSTYTANNAEIRAQRFNGHPRLKWVTRHDSHVRELHAAVDGQEVPSGKTFDLGDGVHLAYPGEPNGPLEYWINCRCLAQRVGEGVSMAGNRTAFTEDTDALVAAVPQHVGPAKSAAGSDLQVTDPSTPTTTPVNQDELIAPSPTPFHGIAAPTDTPSGDGRQLAKSGFSTRNLPLPLNYQKGSYHGGDPGPAVTVGRIDAIWMDDATGLIHYAGEYSPNIPDAAEAIQHVVDGTMLGVSVDVDNSVMEMPPTDDAEFEAWLAGGGADLAIFSQWRIAGITMVAIPAFQEAHIQLGQHPELVQQQQAVPNPADASALAASALQEYHALLASGLSDFEAREQVYGSEQRPTAAGLLTFGVTSNPGTHDGPGWITDPVPTARIRRYWTEGEGRAKIAWGVDGDFDRCRSHLGKYVEPQYLAGTCANMHKEATGAWPGHAPGESESIRASLVAAGARMARAINLVVEAPEVLPAAFFRNPGLDGPTPFTVDESTGHVYGHVATWGTCHIGYSGVCTTAPTSASNYAYYRTGAVRTDEGDVAVGHITMAAGHAPMRAGARAAAAHYDNTAAVVADVAAGEDSYGIWVSGAVRPGLSAQQLHELKAAALSGDWRDIGGSLEMIAALAVNVPGFPIPRTALAASGEHQESLVAAGVVAHEKEQSMADQSDLSGGTESTPKPPAPKAPAPADTMPPETTKPQGDGDAAVNSAVETLHTGLKSLSSKLDPNSEEGASLAELMVTLQDLVKYLGLEEKSEGTPEDAPKELTAAAVVAIARREALLAPRREAAKASIRAARIARVKSFVKR